MIAQHIRSKISFVAASLFRLSFRRLPVFSEVTLSRSRLCLQHSLAPTLSAKPLEPVAGLKSRLKNSEEKSKYRQHPLTFELGRISRVQAPLCKPILLQRLFPLEALPSCGAEEMNLHSLRKTVTFRRTSCSQLHLYDRHLSTSVIRSRSSRGS